MAATSITSNNPGTVEIVFFDLETTAPNKDRPGGYCVVLEFGAIVVCPQKLVELESYCTLIRPDDLSVVSSPPLSRDNGLTQEAVTGAPTFEEVAERIHGILDGRVWAGHNIQRFDCIRIKEAFAKIGRPPPVPLWMIDSLGVLTEKFGRRAGNMKMASLAAYFGLGQQKHRSLDDVRMNLEVLKRCATVLFLESSLPNTLSGNGQVQHTMTTRSRSGAAKLQNGEGSSLKSPPASPRQPVPYTGGRLGKVTESVKNVMCKAQESPALTKLLKHSHSLFR